MSKLIKASDCKCCECGKPAVAFWPVIDPDIPDAMTDSIITEIKQ